MIEHNIIKIGNSHIFYIENHNNGDISVILLHGYNWTSDIWLKSNTIKALDEIDVNVYAVDIPGFTKSRSSTNSKNFNDEEVIEILYSFIINTVNKHSRLFLVGASAGGYLALKFGEKHSSKLTGIIAIAPSELEKVNFSMISTNIFAIYGDKDKEVDIASDKKYFNGRAKIEMINEAGHKCYLDKSIEFNHILREFILKR